LRRLREAWRVGGRVCTIMRKYGIMIIFKAEL